MPSRKRGVPTRFRVGRVSGYLHHGSWWVYYRHQGQPVRRRVAETQPEAEQVASQVNAQLSNGAPTLLAFTPISVADLRQQFLDYHETVIASAMATVRRYHAATQHLVDFALRQPKPPLVHEVRADLFTAYLRTIEVAPNGHPNTQRRRLRHKGIQFILETCRTLFAFAGKRRYLPPYTANPFAELPLDRLKIEDAKPIYVFTADTALAFLQAASPWALPMHFTLAKTGLRVGELTHLLIEDVDLIGGWLRVRNKFGLGWRSKTGKERSVPLLPEVITVIRHVIGKRPGGPVFLRERFASGATPPLMGDLALLERVCQERQKAAGKSLSRAEVLRIARTVWRDAGAVKTDAVRTSFLRTTKAIGLPHASCPKSWRHTFATLLQDANIDPLIRQVTLGHKPTTGSGLGMTASYTHSRPETVREQIEQALRRWPRSLTLVKDFVLRAHPSSACSVDPGSHAMHKEVL